MGRTVINQTSFASGEISPSLYGRVDRDIYFNGAAKLRNVYVAPLGGVIRRPGTKYIENTTTNQKCRLLPFQFNKDQVYLMVVTPAELKVYRNDTLQATVTTGLSGLTATIIEEMDYTQSLDTLILVHPDIQPIKIVRTNDTTWNASNLSISNIPDFDFGSGAEDVWSVTRGWPRSATFFQQRLWFGGSKARPNTLWGSKLAGYFDFDLGTGLAAEAIELTIDDDQVNAIQSIFGGRTLQVFSQSAEYFVPIVTDQTLTPTNIKLERATRHGSARIKPVNSDGATVFVEQSGRVVREYVFLDVEQSYISDDVSYLSEHLIQTPTRMALQKSQSRLPGEYVYLCNTDGTIAVLNRRRAQSFIAWALWETEGEYEDVCVVGNDVYASVKRTIEAGTKRLIEKFSFDYYTDAGEILTQGPAGTSWTGLNHIESAEVYVRSQSGYALLDNTVSSGGALTTERAEESIEVGLGWSPVIRSLPPVDDKGIIIGERRRLARAKFNLKDSNNFYVTTKSGVEYRVVLTRFGNIVLNNVTDLFTGWKEVSLRGFDRQPYLEISQRSPVDFELLSMTIEVSV